MNRAGYVLQCSPQEILIAIDDLRTFESHKSSLQVGRLLQVAQGNNDFTMVIVRNIKGASTAEKDNSTTWQFALSCQPVGNLIDGQHFDRGAILLPVPTEAVFIPSPETLDSLFAESSEYNFHFGQLANNKSININLHGDRFFSKHIAVVGSTGSGKSCAVTRILHQAVGIHADKNNNALEQKNSHIVVFDLHDEYTAAFKLDDEQNFTLNRLDVESLSLPYWLMNSEELESMFIESGEQNSHNQVSQFKYAVIRNKERHNPTLKNITYDTPVYFSLREVINWLENLNLEVIGKKPGENRPKLADDTLVNDPASCYFDSVLSFTVSSTAADKKASNGPFHGQFDRFINRLETKLSDRRLQFLLNSQSSEGIESTTADFEKIMKQFLGYLKRSNVTVIDLSGIPFEVLSISVSLISRLIFDFCFQYTKLRLSNGERNDIPVMIVCEEAHNYIPQSESAAYRASRKSLERIAKEGRKYGLNLMVVSQRPSEVSETVFAQCSNFVALRLTNDSDQAYIRRLFPDNGQGITDVLPNLTPGSCVVVGDSVLIPTIVQIQMPSPEPHSRTTMVHTEWKRRWQDVTFERVISQWRGE